MIPGTTKTNSAPERATAAGRLPNLLYIGPDKAGSTWLFRLWSWHPQVFVTPAKDLYYFDRYYERGIAWYARQFRRATSEPVVAEISHDYLYSPAAAERIAAALPDVRLMICLREPVQRAVSAYLYLLKLGMYHESFAQALVDWRHTLVEHGRYASYLRPYLDCFGRDRIMVCWFDELQADPQAFAHDLLTRLGVAPLELPDHLREKTLPAARTRSVALSRLLKAGAGVARRYGLAAAVGYVKMHPLVQRYLYVPYTPDERSQLAGDAAERLRDEFRPELEALEKLLDVNCLDRWGYR